jgi:hypothetical protein
MKLNLGILDYNKVGVRTSGHPLADKYTYARLGSDVIRQQMNQEHHAKCSTNLVN